MIAESIAPEMLKPTSSSTCSLETTGKGEVMRYIPRFAKRLCRLLSGGFDGHCHLDLLITCSVRNVVRRSHRTAATFSVATKEIAGIVPDVLVPWRSFDSRYQRAAKTIQALERH
jgi:hypothetical protein